VAKRTWLMKTEPDTFGIADLERVRVEPWTGVRSRIARNHMRAMQIGDDVLFYHSSCQPPGVAGIARVVQTGVVDETQFDPGSPYFDEKSTRDAPIWDCVAVEFVARLPFFVSLADLRAERALADMMLFKWTRLSVQPVTDAQFRRIVAMGETARPEISRPARRAAAPRARPAGRRRAGTKRPRRRASPSRR
jgi:predicted RNA-binding protein with PUA-like domain